MKIEVYKQDSNGMIEVEVRYHETIDGRGYGAKVTVWVPAADSRTTVETTARASAADFLRRCLLAHDG